MNMFQYSMLDTATVNDLLEMCISIHPSAQIGKDVNVGPCVIIEENAVIGDECFIGPHCLIRPGSKMGNRSSMRSFCLLDPDVTLGEDVAIYPHATIGGGSVVEDKVYFGPYSITTNCDKIRHFRTKVDGNIIKPPVIKRGAIVTAGCMIKPGVTIGRNSVLGLGSVLTKNIPDNEVWFGNPAVCRGKVSPEDRIIGDSEAWPYSVREYIEELEG